MTIPDNTADFAKTFQDYLDCFVVVGGTPTAIYLEQRGGPAKATQDLDVVIIENGNKDKSKEFLVKLKAYIDQNGYETVALSSGKAQSFRFTNPKQALAPKIIEIATERQDGIPFTRATQKLDDFEMSAIVCEKHIVELLEKYTDKIDLGNGISLPIPRASLLIVMKSYAVINLEKSEKEEERRKHKKHLVDIAKLGTILTDDDIISVSIEAFVHVEELFSSGASRFPEDRLRSCGWSNGTSHERLEEVVRNFVKVE